MVSNQSTVKSISASSDVREYTQANVCPLFARRLPADLPDDLPADCPQFARIRKLGAEIQSDSVYKYMRQTLAGIVQVAKYSGE